MLISVVSGHSAGAYGTHRVDILGSVFGSSAQEHARQAFSTEFGIAAWLVVSTPACFSQRYASSSDNRSTTADLQERNGYQDPIIVGWDGLQNPLNLGTGPSCYVRRTVDQFLRRGLGIFRRFSDWSYCRGAVSLYTRVGWRWGHSSLGRSLRRWAPNFGAPCVFRFLAGVSGNLLLAIHAASTANIFGPVHRTLAWPVIALASFWGTAFSPVQTGFDWRGTEWIAVLMSINTLMLTLLLLPLCSRSFSSQRHSRQFCSLGMPSTCRLSLVSSQKLAYKRPSHTVSKLHCFKRYI
ncbi:uncharacterized protein MYCFIDRAFT_177049 [Pseudocercospora fijiensis CIRAD86]|uniref:Uncharacterized protein n=1 Tax=Pseudocercospora fijiensis (strain CIRAD86) TaxID=383855 RepID=M2YQQ6_PSEFD|nr:uncharacterized protein MYCFIDRAFT_177049 [Pseudocercospora fijiensis CIRAD86]EME80065.1 hypothetical protein MYCFIDRAFT_177049 [Pseudocercospora fijiensis CIRAD86]